MKRILLFSIIVICSTVLSPAQDNTLQTLRERFGQYRERALIEKIYGHLDRKFYLTGETLWFKLYSVDGTLHRPLDVSKVAYVELVNDQQKPVLQAKIEMANGGGHGSFFLPASLVSGSYKFRAYTNWMKNFPPEYYYTEEITIVNPFLTPDASPQKSATNCIVEFFPEGGNLVAGIKSKVAFKIVSSGKPGSCSGSVETTDGRTVVELSPGESGVGHFTFVPEAGTSYRAVLTNASGRREINPFPKIMTSGYVMEVKDSAQSVTITVTTKGVDDRQVSLFAHARNMIAHAETRTLQDGRAVFMIPRDEMPEGIAHLTVFNNNLAPVCERLFFTWPKRHLDVQVEASQKVFGTRKKVSVSINTKGDGTPTRANASLAAYRIDSLSIQSMTDIYTYLWLNADLASNLKIRGSLADDHTPEVYSQIENILLTDGWRRFDWKEVLDNPKEFEFLPEFREHIVTASVTRDGKPQNGVFAYLGSPGKIIRAYGSWSDQTGRARFLIKDFHGPRRIIVQPKADSIELYDLKIIDPFSTQHDKNRVAPFTVDPTMKKALEERALAMQVQDIYYYEDYGTQTEKPSVDSTAFYGKADATYFLDDYTRFPLMEEVMREYVPGVFVRKRRDGFHFVVVDQVNGGVLSGDPIVLLDGVPVPDVDDIMRVDPLRVRKLEVVKRPYYLGQSVFSGIVSYTTYSGDLGNLEIDPRSVVIDYEGLQLKRIFHKPEYTRDQVNNRMPDHRLLLHWQPDIVTSENGNHTLEFYTSDIPGQYVIVVQGISEDGAAGMGTFGFTVENQ